MTIYRTRWANGRDAALGGWALAGVDVNESASDVGIAVELPGIDPAAVAITYDNDVLTVKGEKTSTRKEGDTETRYHLVERTFGAFIAIVSHAEGARRVEDRRAVREWRADDSHREGGAGGSAEDRDQDRGLTPPGVSRLARRPWSG